MTIPKRMRKRDRYHKILTTSGKRLMPGLLGSTLGLLSWGGVLAVADRFSVLADLEAGPPPLTQAGTHDPPSLLSLFDSMLSWLADWGGCWRGKKEKYIIIIICIIFCYALRWPQIWLMTAVQYTYNWMGLYFTLQFDLFLLFKENWQGGIFIQCLLPLSVSPSFLCGLLELVLRLYWPLSSFPYHSVPPGCSPGWHRQSQDAWCWCTQAQSQLYFQPAVSRPMNTSKKALHFKL